MHRQSKKFLRQLAGGFGYQTKYVDYLPDREFGRLVVCEKRILINALTPRHEHAFTILHEIGHLVIHVRKELGIRRHWLMNCWTRIGWLDRILSFIRRRLPLFYALRGGQECDADLWAMMMFCLMYRYGVGRYELNTFIKNHQEKMRLLWLCKASLFASHIFTWFRHEFSSLRKGWA